MKSFLLLAILSTVVCVSVSASAATLYVDGSVSSSGDGTSWETALKTIQEGIDAASDGDTVTAAEGVYVENIRFRGKITVLSSTAPLDPTVVANTVIDGNQAGPVVTFAGNEKEATILSGFTIRNGKGGDGGGILGTSWLGSTGATIENNVITANRATRSGGGLYGCDGTIQLNTITGNSAQGGGGGLSHCDGTIQNNTITGNSAQGLGVAGGGLYECNGTIQNNMITGNSASSGGGGLSYCNGTIQNCIVAGNSAQGGGGGHACNGMIRNCTIIENSARGGGGGLYGCNATIINSTIWGNQARENPQLGYSSTPRYSCIQDWASGGEQNIANIPRFLRSGYWDDSGTPFNPDDDVWVEGDYHLLPDSPCIDAGKNEEWMWEALDQGGNARIFPGGSLWRVDMGSYEYVPAMYTFRQFPRKTADAFQIVWTSEPGRAYIISSCADISTGLWADEATVPCQGVTTRWTDTQPLGRMKFYRIERE